METQEKATPSLDRDKINFKTVELNVGEYNNKDDHLDSIFDSDVTPFVYEEQKEISFFSKIQNIEIPQKFKVASLASVFILTSAIIGMNVLSKNESDINSNLQTKIDIHSKVVQIPVKQENIKAETKPDFIIHKVTQNETLSTIAIKYNTSIDSIVKTNNIKNPNYLSLDTELKIPTSEEAIKKEKIQIAKIEDKKVKEVETNKDKKTNEVKKIAVNKEGTFHIIKSGETIGYLSKIYNVSENKIFSANSGLKPFNIQIGQKVFIPSTLNRNSSRKIASNIKSSRSISSPNYPNNRRLVFPTKGEFSSGFGHRWGRAHTGIDIANYVGTPIYAALSGTVIEAQWDYAYGNSIKVKHSNGWVTRYAHCSKMLVSVGQNVEAGQTIAKMGATGRVTGPHLHFEIIINDVPVNPRNYL